MKRYLWGWGCTGWIALMSLAAIAQPFRTVQEHFLGIPEPVLPLGSPANRQRYLQYALVDTANGYIRYQASDNPERFEFAIFRKKNGQYLAAFSVPYDPDFFERPGKSLLLLLDYQQGQWRNVTRQLLPVPFDPTLTYQLPRVGRDIVVVNARNQRLYRLRWQNDRFVRLPM
ncbi:MAG: hypothetical protein RMI89_11285 [Gloeomargarita sp. SKYBB_i_bin120]|nr:hypothetical protein [Gloeomargarita sp. SKYB120]MDW8179098.1 hypothetical protein [Gloeomargarita sp. SKYBB_i_bin120]